MTKPHCFLIVLLAFDVLVGISRGQDPEPLHVRPGNNVRFQLCFYWEDLPGQPPAINQPVVLQLDVYPQSGYHMHHDSSRPKGALSGTNFTTFSDGCIEEITYTAPTVAGMHPVQITSPPSSHVMDIWVAQWADDGECCYQLYENADLFYKPDGPQPEHPDWYGFNGTINVNNRMRLIGQQYRQQTGEPLCINDMSLNWGGEFDLGPNYGGVFWNLPPAQRYHAEHMYGLNVDLPFSCNNFRSVMYNIALANGGGGGPGGILVHSNHYHLRFTY